MVEEIVDFFDAYFLVLEEGGVRRSCTLFFTSSRLIVMVPEGINPWIGGVAAIAFVVSFVGLLLRDVTLFLTGFSAVFVAVIFLVLVDANIRNRRRKRVKQFPPDEILKAGKRNLEIPYSDIIKVRHEVVETVETGVSRIFLPTPPSERHTIELETQKGRHAFLIEISELARFIDLMNRFVPEKIEEKKSED